MIERFQGETGRARLIAAVRAQKIVSDEKELAGEIANVATLIQLEANGPGSEFIKQDATDNDIFLVLSGKVAVRVNGREVAVRSKSSETNRLDLRTMSAVLTAMTVSTRKFVRQLSLFRARAQHGEPVLVESRDGAKFIFHRIGASARPRRVDRPLPRSVSKNGTWTIRPLSRKSGNE